MKQIVAINASPRTSWNTGTLIREAARGAESEDAEVKIFDLYKLEKFTGCISCISLIKRSRGAIATAAFQPFLL